MAGFGMVLLALTVLATPNDAIVLRSGATIPVSGGVSLDGSRALFRGIEGTLYSIPLDEIDIPATESADPAPRPRSRSEAENRALDDLLAAARRKSLSDRTLAVSEEEKRRLLTELSKSRGIPVAPRPYVPLTRDDDSPKPSELAGPRSSEEWYWRDRARALQEVVRQRKEDLQMLVQKEQDLSDEILGLLSLGYNGNQFGYQVLSLARVRDQIPYAVLAVERAERAYAQFLDDARRQSILPGWLR